MGKLLDPGIGEICDRLSILSLKIVHGRLAGKAVAHFEAERDGLERVRQEAPRQIAVNVLELAAVNAALWQYTDVLRAANDNGSCEEALVARMGIAILQLNDHRAQIVAAINAAAGTAHVEKL